MSASVSVPVEVTTYRVPPRDSSATEALAQTETRLMEFKLFECGGEDWLGHDVQNAPVEGLREAVTADRGWLAQGGTAPVCVDGRWGGRNYPEISVSPESVKQLVEWYDQRGESGP